MKTNKINESDVTAVPETPVTEVDLSIYRSYDQSVRVKTGNDFNDDVTAMLRRVENKTDVIFVKAEPDFKKERAKRGFKGRPIYLKMDHEFLIIDHDKKELLCVLSDGTTTLRNDRAKIKRAEGVDQMILKDKIEAELLAQYPQYRDYTITHVNIFVFPSEMKGSLWRKKYEEKLIHDFCVYTNYSLSSFRSVVGCHQIDAAMTLNQMEAVIKELSINKFRYSFTQNAFANAWKYLYNTLDYLPTRELTVENAKEHKTEVLYALDYRGNDYDRQELIEFANECKIKWRKSWTNKAMMKAIREHIDKHF